ncbi:MAG TPA: regulatory protein RecX [Nitrospira sp.]|nr:regulatory protein RecX [Nitrospira sp.]
MKRRVPQSGDEWVHCAVRYLARFDRTAAQVECFLTRKGASSTQTKQVIKRLSALRYLDDRAYATRWIESAMARRPIGREGLKSELLARGLSEALADEVIGEALQDVDEDTLARRAVRMQRRNRPRLSPRQTVSFLRQRGFAEETIERIIRDCTEVEGRKS